MDSEPIPIDTIAEIMRKYIKEVYEDRGYTDIFMERMFHKDMPITDDDGNVVHYITCVICFIGKTGLKRHRHLVRANMFMNPGNGNISTEEICELLHMSSMTGADILTYADVMSNYDSSMFEATNNLKQAFKNANTETRAAFYEYLDMHTDVWKEDEVFPVIDKAPEIIRMLSKTRPDKTFLDKE